MKGKGGKGKEDGKGGKKKEIYLRGLFDCLAKCVQSDLDSLPLLASLPPSSLSSSSASPLSTPLSFLALFFSLFLEQFSKIQKEEELHFKRRTGKVKAITTTSAPTITEGDEEEKGEEGMVKELMTNSSVVPFWFFVSCVNAISLPSPSPRIPQPRSCLSAYCFSEDKEEEGEEGRKRKREEGGKFDLEGESKFALLLATKMEVLKKMLDLLTKTDIFLQQKQQKGGGAGVLWGFLKYVVGVCCGWIEIGQCRVVHLGEVKGEVAGVKGGVKFAGRQWERVGGAGVGCLESVLMVCFLFFFYFIFLFIFYFYFLFFIFYFLFFIFLLLLFFL